MDEASAQGGKAWHSLLVIPLYVLACLLLLPHFREIIDPDDANYLKIAERYAAGDWRTAINGMWSPLNSWIGAVLLPAGLPGILLFKYLNIGFGCIVLLGIRGLLQQSGLERRYHWPALLGLVPFALYATYHELAADWLQCALVLLYLNLIFSPEYPQRLLYPLCCGCLGAMAYYAKYYNFHFFWLHFTVANFFWLYRRGARRQFWIYTAGGILVLLALALPWIWLLHLKYGFWKLNYTGAYDLAWSLDPQLATRHARALLPPTLPGAASYLEDPVWLRHELVTPFSGSTYLIRQIGISCLALAGYLDALAFFSVLLPAVAAIIVFRFLRSRSGPMTFDKAAALVWLVMPLGYFLFHVEPRFIWPLYILGYIQGLKLLVREVFPLLARRRWAYGLMAGFLLTCCLHPAMELARNFSRDREVARWSAAVAPLHLRGSFVANADQNQVIRLAYRSGMSLAVHKDDFTTDALVDDLTRYKVNYYFEFTAGRPLLPSGITSQLVEVTGGKIPYLRIYRLL